MLRCRPTKFVAHKMVLKMTTNTNEFKLDKLVGMLKVEEMETASSSATTSASVSRSVALTVDKDSDILQKIEDTMGLLARNFGKMMNHSGS